MNADFSDKTVLVTGASGFIGSHLVEELARRGAKVRALVHYNALGSIGNLEHVAPDLLGEVEILSGDVRDSFFVARAVKGAEVVFHLASLIGIPYSYEAPSSYVETNVTGTLNVLEAALRHGVPKVVQTSTSETYGTAIYTPIDEKHPLQAQSPYAATKIAADKLAESYHRTFDLPVATIRPFNTYGPRQSLRAVIPTIVAQALTRDSIELGSLSPTRDLTFVGDTVRGFLAVASAPACVGQVTNVGNGKGISIGDLVGVVQQLLGTDLPVREASARVRPDKSEVFTLLCDNAAARERTGWQPEVSLKDGLQAVIDWVRDHGTTHQSGRYAV